MAYPKERNPAKKTKCPHCSWTGSARGLFGHVRLKHKGMEQLLNIKSENPYVLEKSKPKPKSLGNVHNRIDPLTLNNLRAQVLIDGIAKLLTEYMEMDDPLFPSRSSKLNSRK